MDSTEQFLMYGYKVVPCSKRYRCAHVKGTLHSQLKPLGTPDPRVRHMLCAALRLRCVLGA